MLFRSLTTCDGRSGISGKRGSKWSRHRARTGRRSSMGTGSSGFRTPGRSRSMSIRCTNGWRWHGKWELGLKVRRGQWRMTEFGTVSCLFPPARVIATRRPLSLAIAVQREVESAPSRLHAEPKQPQVETPPREGSRFSIAGDDRCSEAHRQRLESLATGRPMSVIAP